MAGDDDPTAVPSLPDLPEDATAGSVTVDTSGRVRSVEATVGGVGPFEYSFDHDPSGSASSARRPTDRQDDHLRHRLDVLLQALQALESSQDREAIAASVVTVLTASSAAIHDDHWADGEGIAEETREWTAATADLGDLETFAAARDAITGAAYPVVGVLDELLELRDADSRWIQRGARGAEALQSLAHVAHDARWRLSHATRHALSLLEEAIGNLAASEDGDQITRELLSVVAMANNVLLGADDWEPGLADEYRAWAGLGADSGTPEQFHAVRDDVVHAARDLCQAVEPWLYHRVDTGTATQLAHPLVEAAGQARGRLAPSH
jgi:hypothetical protein